jgi:hypothetical protein
MIIECGESSPSQGQKHGYSVVGGRNCISTNHLHKHRRGSGPLLRAAALTGDGVKRLAQASFAAD